MPYKQSYTALCFFISDKLESLISIIHLKILIIQFLLYLATTAAMAVIFASGT